MSHPVDTTGKKKKKKKGQSKAEHVMATPGSLDSEESSNPGTPSNAASSAMSGGPGRAVGATGTGPANAAEGSQVLSSPGAIGTPTKPLFSNPAQSREGLLSTPVPGKDGLLPAPVPGILPRPVRGAQQTMLHNPAGDRPAKQAAPARSHGREAAKGRNSAPVSDPALQSLQDGQGSDMFLSELVRENIHPLKKKSTKFPKAAYFCRTCDYHLDRPEDCKNHIKDTRHKRATEAIAAANTLRVIPQPGQEHEEKLTALLQKIYEDWGLTPEDLKIRQNCVTDLQNFISEAMTGVNAKVRYYGSSFTGLGLKGCDINVDLYTPNAPIKPKMLHDLHTVADAKMKKGELFSNITCNFSSLVPTLLLTFKETGLVCQVAVACYTSCLTSHLLKAYCCLDPRVAPLCVVFRYWAKLCKVDKHDRGTLPPYAYDLMTLHFLQQTTPPVLPFLSKNLPQYGPKNPKEDECDWFVEIKMEAEDWRSRNRETLGQLWLGMLRYYCLDFDMANQVVTLSQSANSLKELKCFYRKKLGIDDPYLQRRNVARTLSNARIYDYLQDCLRKTFRYFALPRNKQGESYISDKDLQAMVEKQRSPEGSLEAEKCQRGTGEKEGKRSQDPRLLNDSNNACLPDRERDVSDDGDEEDIDENVVTEGLKSFTFTNSNCQNRNSSVAPEDAHLGQLEASSQDEFADCMASAIIDSALHSQKLSMAAASAASAKPQEAEKAAAERECHYEFVAKNMAKGDGPVVICGYCDKEGHLKMNCPEDKIPPPEPLPQLTTQYVDYLNTILEEVPGHFMPTNAELTLRHDIVRDLEQYIRLIYPDASLQLFGSSRNGFVFRQSDLDICITFTRRSPESVDAVIVIERLAKHLRKCQEVDNVMAITTAKVPIVKFTVRNGNLDGDISVYNILAQHNTNLLDCYSRIDRRVQTLGYLIKVFVKICEIGDASKGSLSSYAYILMVLHYLQQRKPPVIPVLQELHKGERPERLVEGWNAWFYDDIDNLPEVWPDYGKNKESVAELWIGLFRYYTENFNCKEHVVCVRQLAMLTRFEKLWNGSCLAIEDPFELSHNLGTGLNKRMNNFIFTILQRGRTLYGTPVSPDVWQHRKLHSPQDYFFDSSTLRTSAPPNDRGCRLCGRIGHIAKKCPNPPPPTNRENLAKKGGKGSNAGNADRKKNQGAVASPMMQGNMQPMMHPNMGYGPMPAQNWQMGRSQRPVSADASRGGPRPNQHGRGPFPGPDAMAGGIGGPPGGSSDVQKGPLVEGYTKFAGKGLHQAQLPVSVPPTAGDSPHGINATVEALFSHYRNNPGLLNQLDQRMMQQPENRELVFPNQQQPKQQQQQPHQRRLQPHQQQQQHHMQQMQWYQQQRLNPQQQQQQQQQLQPQQSQQQQQQLQAQQSQQQQQQLQPQQQEQQQQLHGQRGHNQHEQQHHPSSQLQQQARQYPQQFLSLQPHQLHMQQQQQVQQQRQLHQPPQLVQQLMQAQRMQQPLQLLMQQQQEEMNNAFMAQTGMRPHMNPWMPPQYGQEGQGRDHHGQRSPRS